MTAAQAAHANGSEALSCPQAFRIVAELAGEWGLQVGRSLRGGTESFVVAARTAAGEDAVLKITLPGREPEDGEARILIAAGGQGYVRAFPIRRAPPRAPAGAAGARSFTSSACPSVAQTRRGGRAQRAPTCAGQPPFFFCTLRA